MSVNAPNEQLDLIAPDFELLSVDNNKYSLNSIAGEKGTVIVFICNHCPYVIAIAERLSFEANELKKISINTAAIMSNDVLSYPEDSFDNMQKFSSKYNFLPRSLTSSLNNSLNGSRIFNFIFFGKPPTL